MSRRTGLALRWIGGWAAVFSGALLLGGWPALGEESRLVRLGEVKLKLKKFEFEKFKNLSGAGVAGNYIVVCDDESPHCVYVCEWPSGKYVGAISMIPGECDQDSDGAELDLEGIACDGNIVYVIGSHSTNKKTKRAPSREHVFRFELNAAGGAVATPVSASLRGVIESRASLAPALKKAPKKGGVDIEGVAFRDGWLYAGFRGPLEEDGKAVVLKFRFDSPADGAEWLSIDLGNKSRQEGDAKVGIRDIARVSNGFLILAGPTDDQKTPYELHHWNGQGGTRSATHRLCDIPIESDDKAEGLTILREDAASYEFLILYDGPKGGAPARFRLKK